MNWDVICIRCSEKKKGSNTFGKLEGGAIIPTVLLGDDNRKIKNLRGCDKTQPEEDILRRGERTESVDRLLMLDWVRGWGLPKSRFGACNMFATQKWKKLLL